MNQVININSTPSTSNSFKVITQGIFDFITFKSLRDVFNIDLDIKLNQEDEKIMAQELWR